MFVGGGGGSVCTVIIICNTRFEVVFVYCVSIETATKTGMVMVFGEISTQGKIDYQKVIRDCIEKIGYDDSEKGACWTLVIVPIM